MPQKDDGTRMEPAPSEPWCSGPSPAAAAEPAPALEPPVFIARFHGLCVSPVRGQPLSAFHPNSGDVVLPVRIPPRLLESPHVRRVVVGYAIREDVRPRHGAHALREGEVLDRERNAVNG